MKAKTGVLFEAWQFVRSEMCCEVSHVDIDTTIESKQERRRRQLQLSAIDAVLYKAIKDCSFEVELYQELDSLLVPFFEKYELEITR